MFTHVHNWLIPEEIEKVKEKMTNLTSQAPKDIGDSNLYGTEIDLSYNKNLCEVKDKVVSYCNNVYNQSLVCNNYWISISQPNTIVILHNHLDGEPNTVLTAVLYIETPLNCGQLYLENYNIELPLLSGDLITFPSNCKHSVGINNSTMPRICLSFDLTCL